MLSPGSMTRVGASSQPESLSTCRHVDMLTIAFTNQKGGVGKTSTVAGLAATLDRRGLRVLCVDLDPQADLSTWLGLDPLDAEQSNINDAIYANTRGAAGAAVQRAVWGQHLKAVASTLDLAERETDLAPGSEFRLAKALDGVSGYDAVLIDCPPSIGRLVVMAFVAATHAIVITEPSAASLRGVANVMKTISVVRDHYNHGLQIAGIIVNHQARTNESSLRIQEVADTYGPLVWQPYIPARAVVTAAMGAAAPMAAYGAESKTVQDVYDALADQLIALGQEGTP